MKSEHQSSRFRHGFTRGEVRRQKFLESERLAFGELAEDVLNRQPVQWVAAVSVIVDPGVGLRDALSRQPLSGVPYLMLLATGAYVAMLSLTALPRVLALARATRPS